ncbi:MAG: hypothetical protein HKP58_03760 [Desulfatitalea sp.]|nr:hypothetical protein [Desulfatitalea sp.]NNJ99509.1 hypothetical protein [Desulfatitalea sp.]
MDFKKHLETAWNLMLNHLAALIIITLVMTVISLCSLFILAPVMMAGYVHSMLRLLREDRVPKVQDLFSHMYLFLPLLAFSVVALIASMIGFKLLYLPGIAVMCGVTFACLFMLPLMTDEKLALIDAIKRSWDLAMQKNVSDYLVVVVLYIGLMAIGSSVFIGTLFTQPFATLFVLSVYLERTAHVRQQPPVPPPTPRA